MGVLGYSIVSMDIQTEKKLIEKAKVDEQAFGQLFESYYPKLFGYCLKRLGHAQDAQDVAAESFYKAFRKMSGFNWQGYRFGAWLYKIAGNEMKNLSRRKTFISLDVLSETIGFEKASEEDLEKELEAAEKSLEDQERLSNLREEIAEMDKKYREALSLYYFAGKNIDEVAEALGKKVGTVKALLSRGRDKLRAKMQPEVGI